MSRITLQHPDGAARIEELSGQQRRVAVDLADKSICIQHRCVETSYPVNLIAEILKVKGPRFLCDEIMRDEHPSYVSTHLQTAILAYVSEDTFSDKLILDFGCGSGASTMILARLLPKARIIGVELLPEFLSIAKARAEHYQRQNVNFFQSPSGFQLPAEIAKVDFVVLSGVYEHLLPHEREKLLPQLWSKLTPGGIIFIDETPHRYFPIESHTTGLPLINYLPTQLALAATRLFTRRGMNKDSWETLLRKGIRGGTAQEVLRILKKTHDGAPKLLKPGRLNIRDQVDLWYEGYVRTTVSRFPAAKRALWCLLKPINSILKTGWVPYISLAIKKSY